jgi:hypothetical protein
MNINTGRFVLASAVCLYCINISAAAQEYTISTVAGGSPPPPLNALEAPISNIGGITSDSAGNIYFSSRNTVFRLSNGIVSVVAGNTRPGYSGDGGPAADAQLNNPGGLAVDDSGNLYISDLNNFVVRKVSVDGTILTFAGNGSPNVSGDGGPATSAGLGIMVCPPLDDCYSAGALAVDGLGNLYIEETAAIRKVSPDGAINTVSGVTVDPAYCWDVSIAADRTGNLYVPGFGSIRRVAVDGSVTALPGFSVDVERGTYVAADRGGNLYITDTGYHQIRKLTAGGAITTIAGNGTAGYSGDGGTATKASLWYPTGVAVDTVGNAYTFDAGSLHMRKVTGGGTITTFAGNGSPRYAGDGGPATGAQLLPTGVAVDLAGNVYVSEGQYSPLNPIDRVRKISPNGVITTYAGNNQIGFLGDGGPATKAELYFPEGLASDTLGDLYIADTQNHRVRKVTPDGTITTVAGNGVRGYSGDSGPAISAELGDANSIAGSGLALDSASGVYIFDASNYRIRKVALDGTITTIAGNGTRGYSGDGGPATAAQIDAGYSLAVDSAGGIYFQAPPCSVRKVTRDGTISTVAGNGKCNFGRLDNGDGGPATAARLSSYVSVAVGTDDLLYIGDHCSVRKVTPDGVITTVAGSESCGYAGDGGPALSAKMGPLSGLAVDHAGNVYLNDFGNGVIRVMQPIVPGTGLQTRGNPAK